MPVQHIKPILTTAHIVQILGGELKGNPDATISGILPLSNANKTVAAFITNSQYRSQLPACAAAVLICRADDYAFCQQVQADHFLAFIITPNPYAYFAKLAAWFEALSTPAPIWGSRASSFVMDESAEVDESAIIGPNVVIEAGVKIAANVQIGANCVIRRGVSIGERTQLNPNVTIYAGCQLGSDCIIHSGAVIGADGFGFAPDAGRWIKIPQTGRVIIGNQVEIGAQTCVDRGALSDTVIEDGVKLDNLIQIAHNVQIGAHTVIAANTGIAGSTKIGKGCQIGGGSNIVGHIDIADGTVITATTMVTHSIKKAGRYTGITPFDTHEEWERNAPVFRQMRGLRDRIRGVEKQIKRFLATDVDSDSND